MTEEQKCRECGCTWNNAYITDYGTCWWVEEDLCSACVEEGCVPDETNRP